MDCKHCHIPMTPATAAIQGSDGGLEVTIPNFPYYRCERCNARAYVFPDFNMFMLDALMDATPVTKKVGFGRRLVCAKCGAEITAPEVGPRTFSASLNVRQRYPMDVTVRGPGAACLSCGTAQLHGDPRVTVDHITESLIAAFKPLEPLNLWKAS